MSSDAAAAPAPAPVRADSTDTIYLGNLPLDTTRATLVQWCNDNFEEQPQRIRVKKPFAGRGEAATHRYGHLGFDNAAVAASTLELLQKDEFLIGGVRVEASWAKEPRQRAPRAAAAPADAAEAAEGDAAGKKKRRRRRRKKGAAAAEGGAAAAAAAPEEAPEVNQDEGRRVYCKNFGDEATLRETLGLHGAIESAELKEVQRGPGAGQAFAFVTFENEASAAAAVAALGVPEGEEAAEGALTVAMARPRRARRQPAEGAKKKKKKRAPRKPREPTSVKLEEPSTQDLCCRNLPFDVDDAGLLALFKDYPSVESARVIMRNNRSRGYGFVHFGSADDCAAARDALAGAEVGIGTNGEPLNLRLDFATSAPLPAADAAAATAE